MYDRKLIDGVVIFFPSNLDGSYVLYIFYLIKKYKKNNVRIIFLRNCPKKNIGISTWPLSQYIHSLYTYSLLDYFRKKTENSHNIKIELIDENYRAKNNRLNNKINNLEKIVTLYGAKIYNTIRASLSISFTYTEKKDYSIRFMKRKVMNMLDDYLTSYRIAKKYLNNKKTDEVYIMNGRHPNQAAIRDYCENNKIKFKSIEHGEPPGKRLHFASYQIQEMSKVQRQILKNITKNSPKQNELKKQFASRWLNQQRTTLKQNPFITSENYKLDGSKGRLATIFTSSIDENINNLGEFSNGWVDQKTGIKKAAIQLKNKGYKVLVRIHPNALNKSFSDTINLIRSLENESIEIIKPWENVSSYDLLDQSEIVGTWVSTIGLEALCNGKRTFVLGDSEYDLLTGVTKIGPNNVHMLEKKYIKKIPVAKALLAIFHLKNYGENVKGLNFEEIFNDLPLGIRINHRLNQLIKLTSNKLENYLVIRLPILKLQFISQNDIYKTLNHFFSINEKTSLKLFILPFINYKKN